MGRAAWSGRDPSSEERLAAAERDLGAPIPKPLRDFLLQRGGGSGWFSDGYVEIFSLDRLVDENVRGDLRARFPYLLLFGSDGSREYLALDLRTKVARVVMLDITCTSAAGFFHQAGSFDEFLERLPSTGLRFS